MENIINLTGLFLIALGILVRAYPNLIAGYNTLPKEKKEKVDIDGLSLMMRNSFFAIGLITILGFYFLKAMGLEKLGESMLYLPTIIGAIFIVVKAQQFDHN